VSSGGWHPSLTTWVDRVDARWQELGVSTARRREWRIELVTDLAQARLDGAPLGELLAIDPDRFASDVALAHGVESSGANAAVVPRRSTSAQVPPHKHPDDIPVARVAVAGLVGSAVGGVVGLLVLLPLVGWVVHHERDGSATQAVAMLAIYVVAGLVAALCGGFAVSCSCADSRTAHDLGRRAATGLVISGAVATLVTVSLAKATGYSTQGPVILTEVGLVTGICLIGLVLVARSASPGSQQRRRPRRADPKL
jgi:hypothetical protein